MSHLVILSDSWWILSGDDIDLFYGVNTIKADTSRTLESGLSFQQFWFLISIFRQTGIRKCLT